MNTRTFKEYEISYNDLAKKFGFAKGQIVNVKDDFEFSKVKVTVRCYE